MRRGRSDVAIADLDRAGLPAPSVVRPAKIACIDAARIDRRIGRLDKADRAEGGAKGARVFGVTDALFPRTPRLLLRVYMICSIGSATVEVRLNRGQAAHDVHLPRTLAHQNSEQYGRAGNGVPWPSQMGLRASGLKGVYNRLRMFLFPVILGTIQAL